MISVEHSHAGLATRKEILKTAGGKAGLSLALALIALPMGTSPFTVLGLLSVAIVLAHRESYAVLGRVLRQPWVMPVLAWIALSWFGLLYSPDPADVGLRYALKTHYWIYGMAAAVVACQGRFPLERLVHFFLAGLAANALIAFLQIPGLVPTKMVGKYLGLASGYNTLSILLILGILVASFYFKRSDTRKQGAGLILLILVFFANLIIIRGRAGYVVFAVLSPWVVYNLCKGKHLWAGFLLYASAITLMCFSPFVQERISDTADDIRMRLQADRDTAFGKKYSDLEERVYMWYWAAHLVIENPVLGVGTGGYNLAMRKAGAEVGMDHPHNNILHMAVSHGALGVAVLLWFFSVLARTGWKHRSDPVGYFILSGALVLFIGGFLNTHVVDAGPVFLLAVLAGLQAGFAAGPGNPRDRNRKE